MTPSSREADFPTKPEACSITNDGKTTRASSSSSATTWLKSNDPRIVRVSRVFGGKDRHSKVSTVKGLRDRRVRLSVPTAIQLYDLQDRLGLNQPSKVVDWLLNAAKHEIDELPPLQMPPPGNFIQNHHPFPPSQQETSNGMNWEDQTGSPGLNIWNSSTLSRSKSKEVEREPINVKENWTKRNEEEKQDIGGHGAQVSSTNSSLQGLISSVMPYYGSYYQLEPSNFTFSQQTDHQDLQNFNVLPLLPTLSLPSESTTHVLVCPTTQAYFPSHIPAASLEFDPRQINHFHMSTSITPPSLRPFRLNMTLNHIDSQSGDSPSQPNKDT